MLRSRKTLLLEQLSKMQLLEPHGVAGVMQMSKADTRRNSMVKHKGQNRHLVIFHSNKNHPFFSSLLFKDLFINLFVKHSCRERRRVRVFHLLIHTPNGPQHLGLGQAEARRLELQLRLKRVLTVHACIAGSGLTYGSTMPAPFF